MGKNKKGKHFASRFSSSQGPVQQKQNKPKTKAKQSKGAIGFVPYKKEESILTIGDGNFSFSSALASIFEGDASSIVATAYDPETIVKQKYEDAENHIQELTEGGATVLYNIDATNLEACKKRKGNEALDAQFDKIVFNFPHVGMGIKDQARNILANQTLIDQFLRSAISFLEEDGEIHITIKSGEPYDKWNVVQLARATNLLQLKTAIRFDPTLYPGYSHRRTLGFQEGISPSANEEIAKKICKTYVFTLKKEEEETPSKKRKQEFKANRVPKKKFKK